MRRRRLLHLKRREHRALASSSHPQALLGTPGTSGRSAHVHRATGQLRRRDDDTEGEAAMEDKGVILDRSHSADRRGSPGSVPGAQEAAGDHGSPVEHSAILLPTLLSALGSHPRRSPTTTLSAGRFLPSLKQQPFPGSKKGARRRHVSLLAVPDVASVAQQHDALLAPQKTSGHAPGHRPSTQGRKWSPLHVEKKLLERRPNINHDYAMYLTPQFVRKASKRHSAHCLMFGESKLPGGFPKSFETLEREDKGVESEASQSDSSLYRSGRKPSDDRRGNYQKDRGEMPAATKGQHSGDSEGCAGIDVSKPDDCEEQNLKRPSRWKRNLSRQSITSKPEGSSAKDGDKQSCRKSHQRLMRAHKHVQAIPKLDFLRFLLDLDDQGGGLRPPSESPESPVPIKYPWSFTRQSPSDTSRSEVMS